MAAADEGDARRPGWFGRLWPQRLADQSAVAPANEPALSLQDNPLLEAVVSGLPDPVVVLDAAGRVAAFNVAAGALAPALRRGEPATIALRMPELVEAIRQAGLTGQLRRIEFSERVPSDRWWEAFVAPVAIVDAPGLVLITLHDLSPLRRVEEMRADFVANASHELRTPLAALAGFIEDVAGIGARRSGGARALSRHHAGAGLAHGAADRRGRGSAGAAAAL